MAALDSQMCQVWDLDTDNACWDIPADTPQATIDFWQRAASEFLWKATGRRLGPGCPVIVRPCRKSCADSYGRYFNQGQFLGSGYQFTGGFVPYMVNGDMRNAVLCGCSHNCHCGPELCDIILPGPIFDIVQVDINGDILAATEYRTIDGVRLRRMTNTATGENDCWPSCQDLTKNPGLDNTFSVTYRTGLSLSNMAHAAVTQLTAHFIRGCGGGCGCGVGTRQNLQRLSRQGVDLEFADPQQVFTDGRTGIDIVDWFIRGENPYGLGSQLRVLSPDAGTRGRQLPEIWR